MPTPEFLNWSEHIFTCQSVPNSTGYESEEEDPNGGKSEPKEIVESGRIFQPKDVYVSSQCDTIVEEKYLIFGKKEVLSKSPINDIFLFLYLPLHFCHAFMRKIR